MKLTFNRRLMLAVIADEIDCCPPPHSASSIRYALESAINYNFKGEYYENMVTLPNKRQIYRTLKELWAGGLIVGWRIKSDGYNGTLPFWEIEYQLSGDVYRNSLINECNAVFNKVRKAKQGINFFGVVIDMGLPASEVVLLKQKVKSLIQKTHPDKAAGFEEQFMQMKACSDLIKSGIPEPTATHVSSNKSTNTMALDNG